MSNMSNSPRNNESDIIIKTNEHITIMKYD